MNFFSKSLRFSTCLTGLLLSATFAEAQTEIVDGVTWTFSLQGGKAVLGGSAGVAIQSIPESGEIDIPSRLGGASVEEIGERAFVFTDGASVVIPATVKRLSNFAFVGAIKKSGTSAPYSATCYLPTSYVSVDYLFEGTPPAVIDDSMKDKKLLRFILTEENDRVEVNAQFWGAKVYYVGQESAWKTFEQSGYLGAFPSKAQVPAPVITPDGGTFNKSAVQQVELSCGVEGATIYYTVDGSEPTTASMRYQGAFPVYSTTTVRAFAVKTDWKSSEVSEAAFVFTIVINDQIANALNVDDVFGHSFRYAALDWSVVTDGNYAPAGSVLSVVSGNSAKGETGAVEPGIAQSLALVVKTPGTLQFSWKVDCRDSGNKAGDGFAVLLKEGLNACDEQGVPYVIKDTGAWQSGVVRCTQEELDANGGSIILTWAYTSKNLDKKSMKSDGLRLAKFQWQAEPK